ncbi:MAG: hypothetical protein MUP70_17710 [Candidatus Aminicenantes bacterium]|nr:hypothetical protein [Candidatus Aminicenantes bacterium]
MIIDGCGKKSGRRIIRWAWRGVFILVFVSGTVGAAMSVAGEVKDTRIINNKGRFEIELFGGFSLLSAGDLNRLVDYDKEYQHFTYDERYDYFQPIDNIDSWNVNQEGARGRIKSAFPFGLRLKYFLTPGFAVSIGLAALKANRKKHLSYQYIRNFSYGDIYYEDTEFDPYRLSVSALSPKIGIHLRKSLSERFEMEAHLVGGPFFISMKTFSEWEYTFTIDEGRGPYVPFNGGGLLEQEGKGTGLAVDGAFKLNALVGKKWGVLLEAGYAYQWVGSISGAGRQELNGETETWDGRWKVYTVKLEGEWGERTLDFPSNYPLSENFYESERNFRLNLSGPQLQLGLFFRF